METIFDILRRKEADLSILQDEVEKLRAAAAIVAHEHGIASDKAPSASIEAQLAAAASSSVSTSASTAPVVKKMLP